VNNKLRLVDKVAVVTGSTKGIGREIVSELAAQGAKVIVSGRNASLAQAIAQELIDSGHEAFSIAADVSIMEEASRLINSTIEKWGKINILVNNAGITRDNLMVRMSEDEWDQVISTNLKGTFNCMKAVTRQMMRQKEGRIINITSVVGIMGNAGQANYAASKAGIIGLTKSVAKELASRNVTCNAIAPGFIETDMTANLTEKVKEELKEQIPLNRLGKSSDISKVVAFLAGDDSSYITGQVINVDGGMLIA
jgi:3-oxoacyl-[acyl-carrier protein] reductase